MIAAACPARLDVKLRTLMEDAASLRRQQDKVLLVGYTASQCGYTPQYEVLESAPSAQRRSSPSARTAAA